MNCLLALLWLPLLALGGLVGNAIGASLGGDSAGLIVAVASNLGSQLIQWSLWGNRRQAQVPHPWWNR